MSKCPSGFFLSGFVPAPKYVEMSIRLFFVRNCPGSVKKHKNRFGLPVLSYSGLVLRIRDDYTGSRIRIFHPGSRLKKVLDLESGSASKMKEFKNF